MRKITEVLRLHATGTSRRDIARAVGVARSTVAEYLRRAETAGVSWPLPDGLDAEGLEALLFPEVQPTATRPVPDWAEVRKALMSRSNHMTLRLLWLEWKAEHPEAWGYTQYCEHYRCWPSQPPTSPIQSVAMPSIALPRERGPQRRGCAAVGFLYGMGVAQDGGELSMAEARHDPSDRHPGRPHLRLGPMMEVVESARSFAEGVPAMCSQREYQRCDSTSGDTGIAPSALSESR